MPAEDLGQEEGAPGVDVHRGVPLRLADLQNRGVVRHAGIVHQDVDLSQGDQRRGRNTVGAGLAPQVHHAVAIRFAQRLPVDAKTLQVGLRAAYGEDACPCGGEFKGNRPADSLACTRHDGMVP